MWGYSTGRGRNKLNGSWGRDESSADVGYQLQRFPLPPTPEQPISTYCGSQMASGTRPVFDVPLPHRRFHPPSSSRDLPSTQPYPRGTPRRSGSGASRLLATGPGRERRYLRLQKAHGERGCAIPAPSIIAYGLPAGQALDLATIPPFPPRRALSTRYVEGPTLLQLEDYLLQ